MFYDLATKFPNEDAKHKIFMWIRYYQGEIHYQYFRDSMNVAVDHYRCNEAKKRLEEFLTVNKKFFNNQYRPDWVSRANSMLDQLKAFCG